MTPEIRVPEVHFTEQTFLPLEGGRLERWGDGQLLYGQSLTRGATG